MSENRRWAHTGIAVALIVLVSACTGTAAPPDTQPSSQPPAETGSSPPPSTRLPQSVRTTIAPATSTAIGATPTTATAAVSTTVEVPALTVATVRGLVYRDAGTDTSVVDVYVPDGAEGLPAVVLLHGYTRPGASSELFPLAPLAEEIAQLGAVVFFFKWDTSGQYSSRSADDLVCIGSFVQARAADHGARPDRVVVVGHSMGAEVGVNLAFRSFDTPQDPACVETGSRPAAEAVVGIAGDYSSLGIPVDADREVFRYPSGCFDGPDELAATEVFKPGVTAEQAFEFGGYSSMDLVPPGLRVVLVAGSEDVDFCPIPDIARDFADALHASGVESELVEVPGAGHADVIDPDTDPGQTTLKILESILADLQDP